MSHRLIILCFLMALLTAGAAFAQGVTGTIVGTITTEGKPLPGVSVTATSSALQGSRTTTSGDAGGFNLSGLPPGPYELTFELEGMQRIIRHVRVELAQTARADADLKVSAVSESVTVTATSLNVLETPQISTTFDAKTIDQLPVSRTIRDTVLIAPGVNDAGPNDQIVIGGAQSFDSLFLVNGVVVNENLRGQPQNLFIEDAIQETTVLRGGAVSAEYGRFTGGVVTTLTKSGGNEFSGTVRDTITNNDWTGKTPFVGEADHIDEVNHTWEGTLGGRVIRDRLWFFVAGRRENTSTENQTRVTLLPYEEGREQKRYEVKATGQVTTKHNLVFSYINSKLDRTGVISGTIVDLASVTTRTEPNSLFSLHYSGVLSNNLLGEAQFSRMNFSFTQGAETRDLVQGTLLLDAATGRRGWSPTFCGHVCPPKERDNKSYQLKTSYFLSTHSLGDHSIIGGYEDFHQLRNENNYQSGSDFRIHGNFFFNGTQLLFGVDNDASEIEYDPVPALSHTSDFAVKSLFVNDKLDLNDRWSFNIGIRYDKAYGSDQEGKTTVDDSAFSPRLSATYDIAGKGKHRLTASYSRYVSKVDQGPADLTAAAGRYASYYWDYKGPIYNAKGTPIAQMLPVEEVIKKVFDWFNSVGGTKNTTFLTSTHVPGVTTKFEGSLKAPSMDEVALGYGFTIGTSGYLRADAMHRDWKDFYVTRRTLATGKAADANGTIVDIGIIENSSENLERKYNALQLEGTYRLFDIFNVGGNYTWSKLRGNVEGEAPSFATTLTDSNNYPEYTTFANYAPVGYLGADMRHRANIWVDYGKDLPFGDINVSLLQRYHSASPYSAVTTIDVRQSTTLPNGIANPGYQRPPTSVTYFFSERGQYRVDDVFSTDLALRYNFPLVMKKVGVTLMMDILNALDNDAIEDPDFITTTVRTRRNGATFPDGKSAKAFNPYTETPVEGTHFEKDAAFGKPTSPDAYQAPRSYRFAIRLRF
ncbi:MAG TPA: TonB-dependent receptor [Thermoanaerobaculia bacterium]|nr:TonB-dependent receptor [Thermoanaerobaculia bacterium]